MACLETAVVAVRHDDRALDAFLEILAARVAAEYASRLEGQR
jgi:hypothetical protein